MLTWVLAFSKTPVPPPFMAVPPDWSPLASIVSELPLVPPATSKSSAPVIMVLLPPYAPSTSPGPPRVVVLPLPNRLAAAFAFSTMPAPSPFAAEAPLLSPLALIVSNALPVAPTTRKSPAPLLMMLAPP